jgi:hypothetical protein
MEGEEETLILLLQPLLKRYPCSATILSAFGITCENDEKYA